MAKSRGRSTDFGMNDHFPTEINERRKNGIPSWRKSVV
jgi:hypothetical protein